jgi:hypothetical protein
MFTPFPISSESWRYRVQFKLGKCYSPCRLWSYLKPPIYSSAYSANFRPQVTHRTLGSHQIRVFCHRLEQLIGREARREFKKPSVHVLGAEASPEVALTIAKHWPSHLTVARLHCHPPPIKVSIIKFPSSLWSCKSKPHQKLTIVARENSNSGEPPHSPVTRRREREPTPPPTEASRPSRRIGDERPRLEAEITIRLVQSKSSIR